MATVFSENCVEQIGATAGLVWQTLDSDGPMSLAKLSRSVDAPRDMVMQAIGWLARRQGVHRRRYPWPHRVAGLGTMRGQQSRIKPHGVVSLVYAVRHFHDEGHVLRARTSTLTATGLSPPRIIGLWYASRHCVASEDKSTRNTTLPWLPAEFSMARSA